MLSRVNLALKDDVPVKATSSDVTEIKNEFLPSQTANLNIKPYHKYSTTEQVVGEWIDGKPVYEKVFEFQNVLYAKNDVFTDTGISATNIDSVIECKALDANGSLSNGWLANTFGNGSKNSTIAIQTMRNGSGNEVGVIILILQYTKITD